MISKVGGGNKTIRMKQQVRKYLNAAIRLSSKITESLPALPQASSIDIANKQNLEEFLRLLEHHIDLLDRRVLKGETIPHEEKMFSIFETYTEWINKGKSNPSVELGKKVLITTDSNNLIVDYLVMDYISDSQSVIELCDRMSKRYADIYSWSFDKGFFSKQNKTKLVSMVDNLVLPKRGKRNRNETSEESEKIFKNYKNKHSAVESNINELEHCGLDRCPDRGYDHFKRYVGNAVTAYNLRKIGKVLQAQNAA